MRSLVLVEVDTVEHENEIIHEKSKFKSKRRKIEIRKAKFKELWKYVEELTVVKRLDSDDHNDDSNEDDDGLAEIVEEDAIEKVEEVKFRPSTSTTTTTPGTTTSTLATTTATAATTTTATTTTHRAPTELNESQKERKSRKRFSKILFF